MSIISVRSALRKKASPSKAKSSQRFFKTGPGEYGEGDRFIGVTAPEIWAIAKTFQMLSARDIQALLNSAIHEERLAALLILVLQYRSADAKGQRAVYQLLMKNLRRTNNWDLVDSSAHQILGEHLVDKNRHVLTRLAYSKNLWERRFAIVSTFAFIRKGDPQWTYRISDILLKDPEDLIHKAVGWMLREAGKRCSTPELERYLAKRADVMPRTMLRYAIERFPQAKRRGYLAL